MVRVREKILLHLFFLLVLARQNGCQESIRIHDGTCIIEVNIEVFTKFLDGSSVSWIRIVTFLL